MDIVLLILGWLSPVIVAVLTIVATALAKKLLDKMGVERTAKIDELVTSLARNSVLAVEKVALNKLAAGQKVPGVDKKADAVQAILGQLEAAGIRDVALKVVEDRVEAALMEKLPKV